MRFVIALTPSVTHPAGMFREKDMLGSSQADMTAGLPCQVL